MTFVLVSVSLDQAPRHDSSLASSLLLYAQGNVEEEDFNCENQELCILPKGLLVCVLFPGSLPRKGVHLLAQGMRRPRVGFYLTSDFFL